ncbi:MAG: hypothetical protein IJV04_03540, partial [Lachnospiraceae bacterium]|nr:hypothetical protein [Lachnospiraceae bacterium]
MFYPPFTVTKNGGLIMCEDASEFDANYDSPAANVEIAKVEIVHDMSDIDPLEKFTNRMSVLYDQIVEPLMNYDFSFDNSDHALESCEKLTSDTSTIFNVMRIKLLKLAGIVYGGLSEELATEPFNHHIGTFMKNRSLIKQQGIESYDVSWREVPAFGRLWPIENLIEAIYKNPEMLRVMFY